MSSILIDVVRTDSSTVDAQLLLGIRGEKGEKGNTGDSGVHVGTTEPTDPVKNVWIDPSDGDNSVLKLKNGSEWEQIDSIKGDKGDTGDPAGFGEVTATVDASHGTPSVTVTASGEDTAKNFAFAFSNLQPAPYDDSVIQARMDSFTNLEEGSTTGDAELIDGRIGPDGAVYENIGDAIRAQFSSLNNDLYDMSVFDWSSLGTTTYSTGFRMGQYKDDGTIGSSSYQCRLVNDIPYTYKTKKLSINPPVGFSAKFTEFDSKGTYVRTVGSVAYNYSSGKQEIEVVQGNSYRVTVGWWTSAKTNADLTDELFEDFPLTVYEEKNASVYDLYPTGDMTDRMQDIYLVLKHKHICRCAPGDYYITRLRLPDNSALIGADKELTRFISLADPTDRYVFKVGVNSRLANFTLEYSASEQYVPSAQYENAINGIQIRVNGTDEIPYNIALENINVKNFPGCGVFMYYIGAGANGTSLRNVRAYNCSVGFYFGSHAEYNTIVGCYALQCYTGMVVRGGNNIISNCIISECENGIILSKVDGYGTASNDAHGIINACKITHLGHFNNNGWAIMSEGQDYGEIISNCMMPTDIYVKDRGRALQFTGCQFRSGNNITIDNSVVVILNSLFYSGSLTGIRILNSGALHRSSCLDYDGNILPSVE